MWRRKKEHFGVVQVGEGKVEKGKEGEGITNTKDIWKQHMKTCIL